MSWGNWVSTALQVAGTAYAANQANKASKDAANAAGQASAESNALSKYIYDDQRALNMPAYQDGEIARRQFMAMLGLGGSTGGGQMQANYGMNPRTLSLDEAVTMQNGAPIANAQLYATDPAYRQAWDGVRQHHFNESGTTAFTQQTNADKIRQHVAQLYGQYQPTQTGGNTPAAQTPEQAQQAAFAAFRAAPGYQFGLDQGTKAVEASAAARGGLNSGATLKALQKFGNDYADQQGYTPYMNKLASLWGGAQTAVGNIGGAGQNYAGQVTNNNWNAAQVRGQSAYDRANGIAWGVGQIGNMLNDYYGANQQRNGGG